MGWAHPNAVANVYMALAIVIQKNSLVVHYAKGFKRHFERKARDIRAKLAKGRT